MQRTTIFDRDSYARKYGFKLCIDGLTADNRTKLVNELLKLPTRPMSSWNSARDRTNQDTFCLHSDLLCIVTDTRTKQRCPACSANQCSSEIHRTCLPIYICYSRLTPDHIHGDAVVVIDGRNGILSCTNAHLILMQRTIIFDWDC